MDRVAAVEPIANRGCATVPPPERFIADVRMADSETHAMFPGLTTTGDSRSPLVCLQN